MHYLLELRVQILPILEYWDIQRKRKSSPTVGRWSYLHRLISIYRIHCITHRQLRKPGIILAPITVE